MDEETKLLKNRRMFDYQLQRQFQDAQREVVFEHWRAEEIGRILKEVRIIPEDEIRETAKDTLLSMLRLHE